MKRSNPWSTWILTGIIVSAAFALTACSGNQSTANALPETKTLAVFNWEDYIPQAVLDDFKKETGIELTYDTFGSNEDMYQKLSNGAAYDVVFPSTDFIPRMIQKNLLAKLDTSKIPELANINKDLMAKNTWDPKFEYSVPYNFGSTAIVYWKDKVKDPEQSWKILSKPELKNKIMLLDDPREVLGAALRLNGFSINSVNPSEIEKAKKTVIDWKKTVVKFDNDLIKSAFAKKEIYVALVYPENEVSELEEADKANFGFYFPKEGGVMYMDTITILKNAKNVANAYKFINFILKPENLARIYDEYGYPGSLYPNTAALRKQKPWYTSADLTNHEFRGDVGENLALYEKAWEEIKVAK